MVRKGVFGIGSAHKYAIEYALYNKYEILITMDSDGTHRPIDVASILKNITEFDLVVEVDDKVLEESTTYETTRITVFHKDEHGNSKLYSNETIHITVDGPLQIIGPTTVSLIGGSIGIYVKTIGEKGVAKVTINSNHYKPQTVHITVT